MLLGILKIIGAVIILIYGLCCLYLGFTRQGGGVAKVNMVLVPAIFAIVLFNSDRFYDFVMENWEVCMTFVLMLFVGSGMLASFADWELIPGLINGVGLVMLALWLSGLLPQEIIVSVIGFVGTGVAFTFIPLFLIAVGIHFFF